MIKSKKQMYTVIGAFVLVMLLTTVTYAFFNYTRTGVANNIRTGRIYFNSTQGTAINLNNLFPIDPTETGIMNDATKVGTVTINVVGDTTYNDGVEYVVSAVNVNNTVGSGQSAKSLPISVDVSVTNNTGNDPATSLGTSDDSYFENRGPSASTSIYKVVARDKISNDGQLLVGYIKKGSTGVDGNIVIKAYIDKNNVVISDTYPAGTVRTVIETGYSSSDCETALTGVSSASTYCASASTLQSFIDHHTITEAQIALLVNAGIVTDYTNGTPASFGAGKVVFTTTEWNSLQQDGVSFQIKVEANEGVWVEEQLSVNVMNGFPSPFTNYDVYSKVKEIYFNRMSESEMEQRYEAATIKADLTYNNEGKVLAWLETNATDNSKYTMYIASDGETYLTTGENLFYYQLNNAEKIVFNNVNTSRVTNMQSMFEQQYYLKELDLTSFDTSNVLDISSFIYGCRELEKVDMTGLDLRKATNMYNMFYGNNKLTELDLDGVKTRDVTNMGNMFYNSTKIESLNLEGMGGDNLSNISSMFSSSSECTYINMKNFNFGTLTSIQSLFHGMSYLEKVELTGAKAPYVTNIAYLFADDSKLEEVYLNGMNMPAVSGVSSMFNGCSLITKVDLSGINFGTSSLDWLFGGQSHLTEVILDNVNTSNVTSMSHTFAGCSQLESIDLSSFNTANVLNMDSMFYGDSALTTIEVSNSWNVNGVTSSTDMFDGCSLLVGGSGTTYDSTKIDKTYAHIDGGQSNPGYLTLKTN